MSYVQCKNQDEAEKLCADAGSKFVSEDFRAYDEVRLYHAGLTYHIDAQEISALLDLRDEILNAEDGRHEMSFTELVERAQSLEETFLSCSKIIRARRQQ